MKKVLMIAVVMFFLFGTRTSWAQGGDCVGRSSLKYHQSYFQICGSEDDDPIIREPYRWAVVWYEVTTPFGSGGEACFDDFSLKVEGKNESLIPSDHTKWARWDHAGGTLCSAQDVECKNLVLTRLSDPGKWGEGVGVSSSSGKSLCVKVDGGGKHTHAWVLQKPFNLLSLEGIPEGTIMMASVMVRMTGDIQTRIGIDFFDNKDSRQARRRAINGHILQGPHEWTLLKLR